MIDAPQRKQAGRSQSPEDFRSFHSARGHRRTEVDRVRELHSVQGERVERKKAEVAEARAKVAKAQAIVKKLTDEQTSLEYLLARFAVEVATVEEEERQGLSQNDDDSSSNTDLYEMSG